VETDFEFFKNFVIIDLTPINWGFLICKKMSSSSLRKLIVLFLFLTIFSYVFSPSVAEISPIEDTNAFLDLGKVKKVMVLTVTGYSSSPDETDDTPWLTAYNTSPRWGTVASNVLPFGTKIRMPSLLGEKIFIVEDKMHPRYEENIDVWFENKEKAKNFGIHYDVLVEILE